MHCQAFSPCKVAGLIGACLLTAIAIQTFIALIAAAVRLAMAIPYGLLLHTFLVGLYFSCHYSYHC